MEREDAILRGAGRGGGDVGRRGARGGAGVGGCGSRHDGTAVSVRAASIFFRYFVGSLFGCLSV